jgi:hypothetical protein
VCVCVDVSTPFLRDQRGVDSDLWESIISANICQPQEHLNHDGMFCMDAFLLMTAAVYHQQGSPEEQCRSCSIPRKASHNDAEQ